MNHEVFLVPTDFTSIGDAALAHALVSAEKINAHVCLLHVVEEKAKIEGAEDKLEKMAEEAMNDSSISVNYVVSVGNIFDDIGGVADELGASLIFMGTHGLKGWQFLTGSRALKVITNSHVPFIVVQDSKPSSSYENIVMPIDLSKEDKQKLSSVVEVAQLFDSKVHIIAPKQDDEFLANSLNRNMNFAKKYLEDHGVAFDSYITDGTVDFDESVVLYAKDTNADLIAIINHEDAASALFGSSFEQHLITNESKIPVMVVNQKIVTRVGSPIGT
jgi:nucleotide-binding universal stress UspA family protein